MPIDRIKRYSTLAAMQAAPRRMSASTTAPGVELAFVDGVGLFVRDKDNTTWSVPAAGGLSSGAVIAAYKEVAITSAELLALRATPKTLVAAPGAGLMLEFVSLALFLDYNSAAYVESTANLAVRYTGTTGTIVSQAIEATGFADATGDIATMGLPKVDPIALKAACENQALVLHNTGAGEWTTGNSPIRAKISYAIHVTGF
jgi:hypothetical protein